MKTYQIAFILFVLFQIFSIGSFFKNIIKKKKDSLNFMPAFFFFCGFLYFAVIDGYMGLFQALVYLILLLGFNLLLSILTTRLNS